MGDSDRWNGLWGPLGIETVTRTLPQMQTMRVGMACGAR